MPEALSDRLTAAADVADAVAVLQGWSRARATIGAACTGTFPSQETRCSTGSGRRRPSVAGAECFANAIRGSRSTSRACSVNSAGFTTAGAAMAHLDLALSVAAAQARARRCSRLATCWRRGARLAGRVRHPLITWRIPIRWSSASRAGHAGSWRTAFRFADAASFDRCQRAHAGTTAAQRARKDPVVVLPGLRIERARCTCCAPAPTASTRLPLQIRLCRRGDLRALLRRKLGRGVRELRSRA